MWTTTARFLIPALLIGASLTTGPVAYGQGAQKNESDQQFLSRIQSRLDRSQRRVENMERLVRQKMGSTSGVPSNQVGIDMSGTYGQTSRSPMSSDLQSMRLQLRRMEKRIDKDRERMAEQYRSRDAEEFDRDYWEGYARRLERDLDEMERDLRRL